MDNDEFLEMIIWLIRPKNSLFSHQLSAWSNLQILLQTKQNLD